ncbi:hypothetical protein LIER_28014 [Lithospermum erythrorhizon]|uniref:Uncharacterized protein n=1 Tax=Lithospermum erythrorhizon TaxID=34254 RepID=A0AAV3RI79_LITER
MSSNKKLLKMATKWQRLEASNKKKISSSKVTDNANEDCCTSTTSTTTTTTSTTTAPYKADRGKFVVYSYNRQRFTIPLHFLNNEIFIQLLNISEEEYGSIVLSVDSQLLNYVITMVQRGLTKDVQEALLLLVDMNRCRCESV